MRAIVNVSTGRYVAGQERLARFLNGGSETRYFYRDRLPDGCPSHQQAPYAFKACAIRDAIIGGATSILWLDASIVPIHPLEPLWNYIEREGYWLAVNGWNTSQWCVDEALSPLGITREEARQIPHPVATAFGFSTKYKPAMDAFEEWERLALDGRAFRGPWRIPPCLHRLPMPNEVGGHRHDQTALGVVAWRHGLKLCEYPRFFCYEGEQDDESILVATGI